MSKKSQERRKARAEAKEKAQPDPAALEALKRRRNRRLLFVGLIGLSFPILEVIAYRYRTITITLINRTDEPITRLKVDYGNGKFDAGEIKPGATFTRVVRPDFTLKGEHFLTYPMIIAFSAGDISNRHIGRAGALDFSATEIYTFAKTPTEGVQIQHSTRPGFPLSLVRDIMERLGLR